MAPYQIEVCQNYIPYPIGKDYSLNSPIGNLMTNIMASALSN